MTPPLTARKSSENGYRVLTDGVEIGSVSLRERHTRRGLLYWHWGVDTMPLMDHGGRPPQGEVDVDNTPMSIEAGFHDALAAFKKAFGIWHAGVRPEVWADNLERKRRAQAR